ncbi:MAG: right-handed parallel beta-helix repeat-containing protein [Bacteroidota bacterium]|nr:right-handed parallel beta-helix repeat-containing protein [Bacteroidota bacterium]
MLKTIVTILFFLLACPLPLWATDWFVRPAGGNYGAENGSSYNNAWDGWSDITWASMSAGDTLYICAELRSLCTVKKDGAQGKHFVVRGDYPSNSGSISNPSGSGLLIRNRSYVKVMNLTVNNCGGNGLIVDILNATDNEGDIVIENVTSRNNVNNGIQVESYNQNTYMISDVIIRNCTTYNNGKAGYLIHGYVQDISLQSCVSHDDSQTHPMWGYIFTGWCVKADGGWIVHAGDVYVRNESDNVEDIIGSALSYGFLDKETGGAGALEAGKYYYDAEKNKLYVHLGGTNPNTMSMPIVYQYAERVNAYDCIAYNMKNPTGGEGHGMGFEKGARNCGYYRCKSYNNGDENGGSGFVAMVDRDCTVAYCVAYGNSNNGISAQKNHGLKHYNNACYNNGRCGFSYFDQVLGTIKNCIAYSNTEYGMHKGSNVTITNDYNCSYGNSKNFHGITKGPHSLEIDPLFVNLSNNDLMLQSGSPCKDCGANVPELHPTIDIRLRTTPMNGQPDIGACEFRRLSKPKGLRTGSN